MPNASFLFSINYKKLFFILFTILNFSSKAQNPSLQTFKVISLPASAGCNLSDLNKELASASTKNGVIKIIKSHKQLLSIPIVLRVKKNASEFYYWWRINPEGIEKEGDFAIFQSKANDGGKFYTPGEVRKYFRDTIVSFDTLRIGMYLQEEDFRIEDYFFKNINGDANKEIIIPYDKSSNLIITSSLFKMHSVINTTLYNKQNLNDSIGHCTLLFLDETTKASLIDIAKDLKEEMANTDIKELADYLSSYISSNYGKASYKDIIQFLNANFK